MSNVRPYHLPRAREFDMQVTSVKVEGREVAIHLRSGYHELRMVVTTEVFEDPFTTLTAAEVGEVVGQWLHKSLRVQVIP